MLDYPVGPKYDDKGRGWYKTDRRQDTKRRKQREDRGGGGIDVATSQGRPRIVISP